MRVILVLTCLLFITLPAAAKADCNIAYSTESEKSLGPLGGGATSDLNITNRQYARGMAAYVTGDQEGAYYWLSLAIKNGEPTGSTFTGINYSDCKAAASEHLTSAQKTAIDQRVMDWKPQPVEHTAFPFPSVPEYVSLDTRERASRGNSMAQYYVGQSYISDDYTEAARWFYKAAQQGQANAEWALSGLYAGNKNYVEACFWEGIAGKYGQIHRIDVEPGEDLPCSHLTPEKIAAVDARIAAWKPTSDPLPLTETFSELQDAKRTAAQARLDAEMKKRAASPVAAEAGQLEDALYAFNSRDFETARTLLQPLAEAGNRSAQEKLGETYGGYGNDSRAIDYAEAIKWYRKAANQGDAVAQVLLARLYQAGSGVAKNDEEAYLWISLIAHPTSEIEGCAERLTPDQIASVKQRAVAMQADIGDRLEHGSGGRKDLVEAYQWYSFAAASGDARAKAGIERLTDLMTKDELANAMRLVREGMPVPPQRHR